MSGTGGCVAARFQGSGTRLLTAEADKSGKFWREDTAATPETQPLNFRPPRDIRRY